MVPGLDLYYADPAQHLTTAPYNLDDLDCDLSDLSEAGNIVFFGRHATMCRLGFTPKHFSIIAVISLPIRQCEA